MEQKASAFPGATKGESPEVLGKMTKKTNGTGADWGLPKLRLPLDRKSMVPYTEEAGWREWRGQGKGRVSLGVREPCRGDRLLHSPMQSWRTEMVCP